MGRAGVELQLIRICSAKQGWEGSGCGLGVAGVGLQGDELRVSGVKELL